MISYHYLNAFIHNFNSSGMLAVSIFSELYDDIIIPSGSNLQREINENILLLDPIKLEHYLQYLKGRIKSETNINIDDSILVKWGKKYDLKNSNFPFIGNTALKTTLSTWVDQPGLDYENQTLVRNIQKDFYLYAFQLEAHKILTFVDGLLFEKNDSISNKNPTKYYFKILGGASKKIKARTLFDDLVKGKHVDIASKNDFINAFTGYEPSSKINWIGAFGDLKTFINYCLSSKFIEKTPIKWVITSNIFISNGIIFDDSSIRSTKETLMKDKIIKLVDSARL
jgi:hypothetical protein